MTEERLVSLISRLMFGELDPEELLELEIWGEDSDRNRAFLNRFRREGVLKQEIDKWNNLDPQRRYLKWRTELRARRKAKLFRIAGWSAAACLVVALAVGGLIQKRHSAIVEIPAVVKQHNQTVMPGRNTAVLTLDNGRQILLDSVGKGMLAIQGTTRLVKADSGSVAYQVQPGTTQAMTYNVLTTPRSGQFQLMLPDGSRVWLNNLSSLRYPTAFQGKTREVQLTGEAYFEVARDAARPFFVKVKDADVEVLGTSFNIMAYADEGGTQTTLLSGAVAVKTGGGPVRLKPDEQAQIKPDGSVKVLKDVPAEDIVSWKDGFFYFERASFAMVMRQLARWYDVDVVYEGKIPEMEFGGKIDRSLPLNDLLKFLDKNQIHFRLEGRKLIVLPN